MEGLPSYSERLGFHCGLVGPHRCSREVIRCLQPRPARTQEGKKGVTSSYSELVVAPQKSQNRDQASGSAPALTLGTWGLQIRGAESASWPGE